jgi:hypothetical protein
MLHLTAADPKLAGRREIGPDLLSGIDLPGIFGQTLESILTAG